MTAVGSRPQANGQHIYPTGEIPPTSEVQPCGLGCSQIKQLAKKFAAVVRFDPAGDRRQLDRIVQNLGGRLVEQTAEELAGNVEKALEVRAEGDFTIKVPLYLGPRSRSILIGTQLGHYILHGPIASPQWQFEVRRFGEGRAYWEAERFAEAFFGEDEYWDDIREKFAAYSAQSTAIS